MRIRNVVHKGLRRLIEDDDTSGGQAAVAAKIKRMVSFLQDMEREDELRSVPSWEAHQLTATGRDLEPVRDQELEGDLPHRP